ncbi:hypothetical protein [Streptomyces anulatus]
MNRQPVISTVAASVRVGATMPAAGACAATDAGKLPMGLVTP